MKDATTLFRQALESKDQKVLLGEYFYHKCPAKTPCDYCPRTPPVASAWATEDGELIEVAILKPIEVAQTG